MALDTKSIQFYRPKGGNMTFSDNLSTGLYDAVLKDVEDCMVDPFQGKGEPSPGLCFIYELSNGITCKRRVKNAIRNTGNKSNLCKDLSGMYGDDLPEDVLEDDEKMADFINSFIGKDFSIFVEQTTSKTGRKYPKFVSIIKKEDKKKESNTTLMESDLPESLEEDDIPF